MFVNGFILAALTGIGFLFLYKKLPRRMRKFMQKHVLFTDFLACLGAYVLLGGTLTALIAAAWLGLAVSIILFLMNEPSTADMIMKGLEKLEEIKENALKSLKEAIGNKDGNSQQSDIRSN